MRLKRFKKLLLKKEKGTVSYVFIILIVMFLIISMTLYELTIRKTVHLKMKIDNSVILSALSANIIDIYQFATFNDVAYATSKDIKQSTGYIDIDQANQKAGSLAFERFMHALNINLKIADFSEDISYEKSSTLPIKNDSTLIKSANIDKFILYNVIGKKVFKVEKDDSGVFTSTELLGNSDPDIQKASNIQNSSLYVKMDFIVYVIGKDITMNIPFEEYVDIQVEK